eukprot:gene2410-biopygen9963
MGAAAVACRRCCCCEALVRWANAEERSAEERRLRRLFVPVLAWCAAVMLVVAWSAGGFRKIPPAGSQQAGCLCLAAALLCATAAARRPPARVVEGVMVAGVLSIILIDAAQASWLDPRMWSCAVILMDAGLVTGARAPVQLGVVAAVLAWLRAGRGGSLPKGVYLFNLLTSEAGTHANTMPGWPAEKRPDICAERTGNWCSFRATRFRRVALLLHGAPRCGRAHLTCAGGGVGRDGTAHEPPASSQLGWLNTA